VLKPPAVRRAELIDCAQGLFLEKGYERTTINDVIAATGLSKGAFYHHFRAKEELLEAITERFGRQALTSAAGARDDVGLNALQRLNRVLAMGREWKIEHLPQLRAMFITLLRPDNLVLYHRICNAVFQAMEPPLTAIIEQGVREGVFDVIDARTTADALLRLAEGRRAIVVEALATAEAGDVDLAVRRMMVRVRAEEQIADRILGLAPRSVTLIGDPAELQVLLVGWLQGQDADPDAIDRAARVAAAADAADRIA
jgi:AcrR family transcriptional regulator